MKKNEDKGNIFNEIPNYYLKLSAILCDTKEKAEEFINHFYTPDDVSGSLRKYRRFILDYRSEEANQFFSKLLQYQIFNKDWKNLYITIKELFLEPFDEWIMDKIVEKIQCGLIAEDIYNWYLKNKNIKSIITFDIEYIKAG